MIHASHVWIGTAVLLLCLTGRALVLNSYVRRRLSLSAFLAAIYLFGNIALLFVVLRPEVDPRIRSWEHLLLILAVLNALIVVTINPLRQDRLPDRFPGIMQDAILVVLFLMIATFVFEEKLATASAVGAVVIGFALQDTLGNAFAGLAIQMEKPFRIGHWVAVGSFEGRVAEITWRATKLRTKTGNVVIVPNNIVSKEAITNYSEPTAPTRLQVEVGASYLVPPGDVKRAIAEALANSRRVLKTPPADVVLLEFGSSSITYRARFWVDDYERDEAARDEVRSAIFYAFSRRGIEIPWPIQVEYQREEPPADPPERLVWRADALSRVGIFASLSAQERERLAVATREQLYGNGEAIVRQGEEGASLFVISSGGAVVTVDPGGEVATLHTGDYFGEMSLLTGAPRSATVSARGDCRVFEIDAEMFRQIAAANPSVLEQVGNAAVARRTELHAVRDSAAPAVVTESSGSLLLRMKRFLRLT